MVVLLAPAAFLLAAAGGPALGHMGVYLSSEGYPSDLAAWLVSALGLTMTLGKCVLGSAADRFGPRQASLLFGAALVLGQMVECLIPLHDGRTADIGLRDVDVYGGTPDPEPGAVRRQQKSAGTHPIGSYRGLTVLEPPPGRHR